MTDRKIGTIEAIALVLTVTINHIILNLPQDIINTTSSASILNVIFVSLIALGIVFLIAKLFEKFPGMDIFDVGKYLGGKWLQILLQIAFFAYFIFTISILLRSFSEGLKIIFFPRTPVPIIMFLFLMAMIILNKLGRTSIIRANLFFMPLVLFSILFIFIANIENFTVQRALPLLGNGVSSTFFSGLSNLFAFGGISYLYLIPPHLKDQKNYTKIALTSIGISAFFLLISVATLLFTFPFVTTSEEIFPLYLAARFIEFGRFFQRLDAIFVLTWFLSMIGYLSIAFSFASDIFQKMAKLQSPKWIFSLLALLVFGIALLPQNMEQVSFLEENVYSSIILVLVFEVCLSILVLSNIKHYWINRKKGAMTVEKTSI